MFCVCVWMLSTSSSLSFRHGTINSTSNHTLFYVSSFKIDATSATDGEHIIRPALSWLASVRDQNYGWGVETHRALLSLQRNSEIVPNVTGWDMQTFQGRLCNQEFDINMLVFLLKYTTIYRIKFESF